VVPGDYDGDGAMDIMMLSLRKDGKYDVYIAYGDTKNLTCPTEKVLTVTGQPLLMDYNGDMIADLFGADENGTRTFWLFTSSRGAPLHVPMLPPPGEETLPPLRIPSSHAFVDLNGDLAADLFVTAENKFEIWENTLRGFKLKDTIPVPGWAKVVGQTTFMDVSLNGIVEPLTVMCRNSDCSDGQIYVWSYANKTLKKDFLPLGPNLADGPDNAPWHFPCNNDPPYPYTDVINLRAADIDLDG
jgi:integrin alpha FG-GAP repeat containing protein 1